MLNTPQTKWSRYTPLIFTHHVRSRVHSHSVKTKLGALGIGNFIKILQRAYKPTFYFALLRNLLQYISICIKSDVVKKRYELVHHDA